MRLGICRPLESVLKQLFMHNFGGKLWVIMGMGIMGNWKIENGKLICGMINENEESH